MDRRRKPYPERAKERIRCGQIIERLRKCALGEIEMTATAVNAGRILLNKTLPDLKAIEYTGTEKSLRDMNTEDILSEIERLRAEMVATKSH